MILEAFSVFKQEHPDARLILVPRHPERFDKVAALLASFASAKGYGWHRYSEDERLQDDVVLVDRLGELVNLYAISDIVILGGSFVPVGGHNAAEAAQFGCRIISGSHYFNQREIFDAIEGIVIVEAANLSRRLRQFGQIKPARLKYCSDLSPVIETLRAVLSKCD